MIRFIIRRLLGAAVVVWIVSVVTFVIFQLAPTLTHQSPVYYYIAKQPPPQGSAQFKELEHAFGFDRPLFQQYWNWLTNIFHPHTISNGTGETTTCPVPCLGYSFKLHTPVSTLIWQALPVSLSLAVGASILWLFGGLLVGTISGLRPGSLFDRAGMIVTLTAVSVPIFFTGPILLLLFVYTWGWLPDVTYAPLTEDPLQWLKSMILPWIALAGAFAALYARLTRATMMETMSEDYIRTARAKGLPRRTVVDQARTPCIADADRHHLCDRSRHADRRHGNHRDSVQSEGARLVIDPGDPHQGSAGHHGRDDRRRHRTRRRQRDSGRAVCSRRPASQVVVSDRREVTVGTAAIEFVPESPSESKAYLSVRDLRVQFPTEDGIVKAVNGINPRPRPGPDARHRRRIRLGQVSDQPGDPGAAQGHQCARSPARSRSTVRISSGASEADMREVARRRRCR